MPIIKRSQMPWIIAVILCGSILRLDAKELADHLVPAEEYFGPKNYEQKGYWKLIEEKLFVTPGDIARFVQFPGAYGTETALSIYRASGNDHSYWVTITQPSSSLWERAPHPEKREHKDRSPIRVERCDASLPDSTAVAVRRVWLKMLT